MSAELHIRTGLGKSIVAALAGQLHASVELSPEQPGTHFSIRHIGIALLEDEPGATSATITTTRP